MAINEIIEYENLKLSNNRYLPDLEEAASRVIRSGWYILGNEVVNFEAEFSKYIGSRHCIGVASGLDALILSLEALAYPRDSEILVASNSYIATILAIVRAGYKPILVEPEVDSFNIDPTKLKAALSNKTRAICLTHLFGKACRMDEISAFAQENGLQMIEDCAQSHGAKFAGKMTGTFGVSGCFSFYPTKNLGAFGDAGAIITNNDEFADRLRHMRNYGSKEKYINEYIGMNSRLDEMQAALLRVKLKYLDEINQHKRSLAEIYFEHLPDWVHLPRRSDVEHDVFHIFGIRTTRRDELREWLLRKSVKTEIHYPIPPHKQKAMQGVLEGCWPIADELHSSELSLPISAGHTHVDVLRVCELVTEFGKT
jgi:dTDP-4-amino-4,6-dideoxygalactose transaminase